MDRPDAQLICLSRQGDREAFAGLVTRTPATFLMIITVLGIPLAGLLWVVRFPNGVMVLLSTGFHLDRSQGWLAGPTCSSNE